MSLPITFNPTATTEFIEASAWYEERQLGLGAKFMAEIERCVSLISEHPFQYAIVHKDIRCIVANRFPYSVYFRVEECRIIVLAVFHTRRDPTDWKARN